MYLIVNSKPQFNIQQLYVLPHTAVFMCFVWISEQTAIISLCNINILTPNVNYSGRTAPLTSKKLHFIYLFNKYMYRIF